MMGEHSNALTRAEIIGIIVRLTILTATTYFGVKWMVNRMDPTYNQKLEAKKKAKRLMEKIGIDPSIPLTDYEMSIASQLVEPLAMSTSWGDIAGLESVIQELRETVILPIQKRELFTDSDLIKPPKGVLLHGPPGCGKTMIARATAKEASMRFINLEIASLTDKWYGESQKLSSAVFSLAIKLQPCIVFIDEIDSFLRSRDTHDHEATAMMKAQFMSMWDGLITDNSSTVIVMGATNRPQDVDKAILRRMPAMFHIGLPNIHQRRQILKLILQNEPVTEDVDYNRVSKTTEGFSGSDLRELCRNAAVYRVRDYLKLGHSCDKPSEDDDDDEFHDALRPICMDDFAVALAKMKESKVHYAKGAAFQPVVDLD